MSFSNTTDYRGLRQQKVDAMEALISKAQGEKRNLNAKEAESFDQLERECRQLERSARSVESYGQRQAGQPVKRVLSADEDKRTKAFDEYMRRGIRSPELEKRTMYDAGINEAGFQDSGTAGGFMVAPGFWDNLQIALKAYNGYSSYYRLVETPTGTPMSWPTLDPTGVSGSIIGEGVQDSYQDYVFGQGVLEAWTYTNKVVLVSVEMVNDSAIDIQSLVSGLIGEGIGRAVGAHSVNGSGSGQPLGLQTALAAASRYVTLSAGTTVNFVGGGSGTELVTDTLGSGALSSLVQNVDSAYWPGCAFYMSPTQFINQQQVADGYGRPLYPSLQEANPTLLGFPVRTIAQAPAMVASTSGGIVFGDLSVGMVRRSVNHADLLALHERWAEARQVGYYGFIREDHRSNDLRAVTTVLANAT